MGRLAEMLAGKGSVLRVTLPRAGQAIGIIPLTTREVQDAQVAALEMCSTRRVPTGSRQGEPVYSQELGVQLAARFLVEPDPPHRPLASNADEVRQMLLPGEVDFLCLRFGEHAASVCPSLDEKPQEELHSLGEAPPSASSSGGSMPGSSKPSSAFQRVS